MALALAGCLGACAFERTIGEHAIGYNRTVEQATDALMLMNILRARDQAPLHFTTIGNIRGGFSVGASLGYDGSTGLGSGLVGGLSGSSNPGFDIGPLDRQEFARGIMRPLDPALFRVLWDRNMPDQLLIYLLVSRFDEGPGGRRAINDPALRRALSPEQRSACAARGLDAPPPCDPFQAVVDQLTANGPLVFNGYTRFVPIGPRLSQAQAAAPELLAALREPGLSVRPDGTGFRLMRAVAQMALCIPGPPDAAGRRAYIASAVDADPPQISPMPQAGNPCRNEEVLDAAGEPGRPNPPGIAWYIRSVEEVLQYLGQVQRAEEAGVPYRITLRGPPTGEVHPRLFRLWREPPPRPRMQASYRGETFHVAENDDREDMTLRVLALVTQLLNLQKAAGDIATSNSLRLVR